MHPTRSESVAAHARWQALSQLSTSASETAEALRAKAGASRRVVMLAVAWYYGAIRANLQDDGGKLPCFFGDS